MMNKALIIIVLQLISIQNSSAQYARCPKIPENYFWNTAEDYKKDSELVKKVLVWLCKTPLGIDVQQRSVANAFVMEWLAGSPQVTVEIATEKLTFYDKYPDLLFSFIHGVTLLKMEKPNLLDEVALYGQGYETVASLASQSEELSKEAEMKPLLKAYKKNRIKAYTMEALSPKVSK